MHGIFHTDFLSKIGKERERGDRDGEGRKIRGRKQEYIHDFENIFTSAEMSSMIFLENAIDGQSTTTEFITGENFFPFGDVHCFL